VPCLRVGRRLLFNPAATERALLDRAEQADHQERVETTCQGGRPE
jgi:hypothetical protein